MNWNVLSVWYPYILALTLFVGKIATFSFLIAPIVHKILEKDQAVKLLRVFFPRYYKFGIGCCLVGLVMLPFIAVAASKPGVYWWGIFWAILLLAEVYALKVLVPTIEATREGRERGEAEATQKWQSAHELSVRLNVMNLLLGLILIGIYVR